MQTPAFQSTRLSRASTLYQYKDSIRIVISIHKALTSLDGSANIPCIGRTNFNPQGSHEPRPPVSWDMDYPIDFNPQGSHEPRPCSTIIKGVCSHFNPQGSHEPRLFSTLPFAIASIFQSTRLSRASTAEGAEYYKKYMISIHKALTSLDFIYFIFFKHGGYFNPQGSHEPRPINSTASTLFTYFNPQGSHEPRRVDTICQTKCRGISIHKALTSLDIKGYGRILYSQIFQSTRLSRASTKPLRM